MGLFSKIVEMIKRSKMPKLNAGNNYQQNQRQSTKNNNYLQLPYTITLPNNEELMVTSIQGDKKAKHANGEITNIILAKVCYKPGDTIYVDDLENIAFEIPEEAQIDDVILQKIGQYYMYERNMPDNNEDCMYLGKLSRDPYDLGTKNKSETVKMYINETVAPQIAREKQEQNERKMQNYKERQERENVEHREFVNKMHEKYIEYLKQQNEIKIKRMKNPYLKINKNYITNDGKRYCDYDGINVLNGDILRLRKMNIVGHDENGTYIYTGYVESVQTEDNVEMLLKDGITSGMPICFASDKKIEEIIQSDNPNDLKSLLVLLSQSEELTDDKEYLNYIGKIDKYNTMDKNIGNTTKTIQSTVKKLQQEFYQKKVQERQMKQNENQI